MMVKNLSGGEKRDPQCAGLTADQNNSLSFLKGVQEGLNPLCGQHNTKHNLNSESRRLRAVCADVATILIQSEL